MGSSAPGNNPFPAAGDPNDGSSKSNSSYVADTASAPAGVVAAVALAPEIAEAAAPIATAAALRAAAGAAIGSVISEENPVSATPLDPGAPMFGDGGVQEAANDIGESNQQISPLVLDLTGTGIELTPLSHLSPYFDLMGNGFARKTGWIGQGTGLLAIDRDGDGQVNDITELFGQHGATLDGFTALRALDSNGDGAIDSRNAAFGQLRVWVNSEGDGAVHPGELLTLAQLGIASISLEATVTNQVIAGNTVKLTSSYTLADGTPRTIDDVWFSNSATYTKSTANVALSAEVAVLPELTGHGTVAGLRTAMMADPALKAMVTSLAANPSQASLADMQAIMLRWSGSAELKSNSRGGAFDARRLDFLEKYTGIPFTSYNGLPRWRASISLAEGWTSALNGITARLLLQSGYQLPEWLLLGSGVVKSEPWRGSGDVWCDRGIGSS